MLKEHFVLFRRVSFFVDLCLIPAAFFLTFYVLHRGDEHLLLNRYIWMLPLLLLIWGRLLAYFGLYESFRTKRIRHIFASVLKTAITGFLLFGSFSYVFKVPHTSRVFVACTFFFAASFILIERLLFLILLRVLRQKGYNFRRVLLVGVGDRAKQYINIVDKHVEWGLKIVGIIDKGRDRLGESLQGCKILGGFEDIPRIIADNVVDEVVFAVPRAWLYDIEEIIQYLEIQGKKVSVVVNHFKSQFSRETQTDLYGLPIITFETVPGKIEHLFFKRLMDIVFSSIGLILLSPFFAGIAIVVKLSSKGRIFFSQKRVGLNGRIFTMYKFRTMIENAEAKLEELKAKNEMQGPVFKITDDPRLTKIGKFLRKTSLDELPQLWNVLRGDMSLVGPRPPIPSEVMQYQLWQKRRLSMRPGLTCLWQVKGRNTITDFDAWMKLDLKYIDDWSLSKDFKILCETVPTVLFGVGAK